MTFALSTNWNNRRLTHGEEIAEEIAALGFGALELGFRTTAEQIAGIRRRLDLIPVGSVHAFCPVPVSASSTDPGLYALGAADAETRAMARVQVLRTVRCAADLGADAVVLHAGCVPLRTWFRNYGTDAQRVILSRAKNDAAASDFVAFRDRALKLRARRGRSRVDGLKRALEQIAPELTRLGVTLALENLPFLEGFPDETELEGILADLKGAPVAAWFDTGHDRVRASFGWRRAEMSGWTDGRIAGVHLNDVVDFTDDHLAPGDGRVDFAALAPLLRAVRHVVFEPNEGVSSARLAASRAVTADALKRRTPPLARLSASF